MNLTTPLEAVSGIGPNILWRLKRLNLNTVGELITHYPFRYDDFSNLTNTLEAQVGERVTIVGEIWSIKNVYTRSRKVITQAVFNDGKAPIELVWFNQSYLTKSIQPGDRLQISGKVNKYKNKLSVVAPVWEKVTAISDQPSATSNNSLHTGRLVAVYPETEGLSSKWFRTKINLLLPRVEPFLVDPLPLEIKGPMYGLREAIKKIHLPENLEEATKSRERLGFDELFYIQLATQKARIDWQQKPLIKPLKINKSKLKELIDKLPFQLTKAQLKVVDQITEDLKKTTTNEQACPR